MAAKDFAEIDTGFPIFGLRFINNHTLLTCGGGGEGNNGIPNKVTAVRCSFTVSDKSRRLQKFREITLPSNEDSPMCVEFCLSSADDSSRYLIFVGCNQSTELIRSMNINNNLRKYNYTDDEHLQFLDAVQFDENLLVDSIGEYPRIMHLSADASIGGMMTSRIPSEIFIFNPDTLELKLRFKAPSPSEIKDFHLNPRNSGETLTYVTASFIETISTNSGNLISSSSTVDKKTAKTLGKYFFSKVRYVDETKVIITAALRNGKGSAVLEYNTETKKVTKEKLISKKVKGIVAIDVSKASGLFAVAGNDFSVSLLKLSDFKVVKTYTKLHKFAVTCLSFSPDGKKLATGSASNTLNVLLVKPSSGGFFSFVYSLFRFVFFAVLIAVLASFVQRAHESGELDQYIELSKLHGEKALVHLQHFQEVGLELSQKYGKEYFELSQHYGKIGYGIAKEQSIRGLELIKEKINKHTTSKEKEPIIEESSALPEWVSESTGRTTILLSDIVGQYTKDVHDLTKGPGKKDTLSIINQATQLTIVGTATPTEVSQTSSVASLSSKFSNEESKVYHNEATYLSTSEAEESIVYGSSSSATDVYEQQTLATTVTGEKPLVPEKDSSMNIERFDTETTAEATTEVSPKVEQTTEASQVAENTESTNIETAATTDVIPEIEKSQETSASTPLPPHDPLFTLSEQIGGQPTDLGSPTHLHETTSILNEEIRDISEKEQVLVAVAETSSLGSVSVEPTAISENKKFEIYEDIKTSQEHHPEAAPLQDHVSIVEKYTEDLSLVLQSEIVTSAPSIENHVVEEVVPEPPVIPADVNSNHINESILPQEESFVDPSESVEKLSNLENIHPDIVAELEQAAEIEKIIANIESENSQFDESHVHIEPEANTFITETKSIQSTTIEPVQTSVEAIKSASADPEINQHQDESKKQFTSHIETSEGSEVPVSQPETYSVADSNINSEQFVEAISEDVHVPEPESSPIDALEFTEPISRETVHSEPVSAVSDVAEPPQEELAHSSEASKSVPVPTEHSFDEINVMSTVGVKTSFPETHADHDEL